MHTGLDKKNVHRDFVIPENIIAIFLPLNVTSRYQPMDMGIIVCFKVGYHVQLLDYHIQLFDVKEGHKALESCRGKIKPGCKGLHAGRKPIILDLMDLSVGICNGSAK